VRASPSTLVASYTWCSVGGGPTLEPDSCMMLNGAVGRESSETPMLTVHQCPIDSVSCLRFLDEGFNLVAPSVMRNTVLEMALTYSTPHNTNIFHQCTLSQPLLFTLTCPASNPPILIPLSFPGSYDLEGTVAVDFDQFRQPSSKIEPTHSKNHRRSTCTFHPLEHPKLRSPTLHSTSDYSHWN
jgi:hypothetical protein